MLPRFLLVEDSEDDAFFLERSLSGADIQYQLDRARNGHEALEYLQKFAEYTTRTEDEPAVIFLDLKMPGMNGFQVLEWIDDHQLHDRWDVIVLSGSDQSVDIQQALQMGAKAYLVKPPTVADIRECVVPRLAHFFSPEKRSSTGN